MSGSLRITGLLLLCLGLFTVPGCDNDNDNWGQVGFVHFAAVGSQCWTIAVEDERLPNGYEMYEVRNLKDRYRVDGLWVRFEYVVPEEWASTCMVGEVIILTRIEER